MTDPLRGRKAPLEETQEDVRRRHSQIMDDAARLDQGSDRRRDGFAKTSGEVSAESDVSSRQKEIKKSKRWKKRLSARANKAKKAALPERQMDNQSTKQHNISQRLADRQTIIARPDNAKSHQFTRSKKQYQDKNRSHNLKGKDLKGKDRFENNSRLTPQAKQHRFVNSKHKYPLYAALDLGTNNCRLLIAKPVKFDQFHVVDSFSHIVRLGEGLAATGKLSDDAMDRAMKALKICASKLARYRIRKYRLIATEACRQASNGAAFLARVMGETGLDFEIIDRETEAKLAVSSCASLIDPNAHSVILFDIGGGSSEIAAIQFDERRTQQLTNHIKTWTSLPVGVVTLSERHGGQNVTPYVFDAMVEEVDEMIKATAPQAMLDFTPDIDKFHLLGTSGTVTTLAGLHLDLLRYDRRRVDGLWLKNEDVDKMLFKLLSWNFQERSANPCIGPERSDLVLAGCAIMQSIRKRWPSRRMRVADRGLREGLLNDMMLKDGVWDRYQKRRYSSSGKVQNSDHRNKGALAGK